MRVQNDTSRRMFKWGCMVQVALAVPGKEIITASQAALPQKCPNFLQDFLNLSSRSLVFQALVTKYIHRHTQAASREEYALGAQVPQKSLLHTSTTLHWISWEEAFLVGLFSAKCYCWDTNCTLQSKLCVSHQSSLSSLQTITIQINTN